MDIVERLREQEDTILGADRFGQYSDVEVFPNEICQEAADEIERLRRRVAMLEDALKKEWTISEAFALLADGMEEEGNNGHC